MNLVAGDGKSVQRPVQEGAVSNSSLSADEFFVRLEDGVHGEQSQATDGGALLLHRAAQHLEAAADSNDRRAAGGTLQDFRLETGFPHPEEIGRRALRSGQDDEVRAAQILHPLHIADPKLRMGLQRCQIREVGDARKADDRHIQNTLGTGGEAWSQGVLLVDIYIEIRNDAEDWNAGTLFQEVEAVL